MLTPNEVESLSFESENANQGKGSFVDERECAGKNSRREFSYESISHSPTFEAGAGSQKSAVMDAQEIVFIGSSPHDTHIQYALAPYSHLIRFMT